MATPLEKPRLLYQTEVRRGQYWRRLTYLLLGVGAAAAAYWALAYAGRIGAPVDSLLLDVGKLIAVILAGYFAVLTGLCLYRALTRRSELIRLYDRGFAWQRGREDAERHPWSNVITFREGATGLYLGKRPLAQWGAHRLTLRDGTSYRFTHAQGDTRRFARAARPSIAHVMGARIARTLREEEPVRLHRRLIVYPGGVQAGKREIPWSKLDLVVRRGTLQVRELQGGAFKTVARYPITKIDNLGGFMELALETIRTHQPDRFRRPRQPAEAEAEPKRKGQARST